MSTDKITVLLAIAICAGCAQEIPVHTYDRESLKALEAYNPKYNLDDNGRVVELRMEGQHVDNAALIHVKDLTELATLSLYGSSVTNDGLKYLQNLGRLNALGVGKTKISDDGLVYIAKIPNLKRLWISENTKVTKEGIAAFKEAHPSLDVND